MSFDWSEYLRLARFLQVIQKDHGFSQEAAFRCAVSRAYYSAFCCARNLSSDRLGFHISYDSSDHWRLRNHFRQMREIKIADNLERLSQWRKQCDYDDVIHNVSTFLNQAINKAQEVLNRLNLLGSS